MRRRRDIFVLLASENINTNNIGLSVTVLAGLRGRIFDNLARKTLDNYVRALLQGT